MVKNISLKNLFFIFLFFSIVFFPKDTFAQTISPSNFLIKNSNNTAVLYQSSNRDYFTSTPYYSGKFEINLAGTSVDYNASYGLDMYLTLYVGAFSDYGNFGYANPELFISYNGLHQTDYTISSFSNTKGTCSNVVCPYQLHLAFTFSTQYQGTLYLALPYDIPFDTYGWTLNSMELTNYGSNTSNSDIIANNNQNTNNIISNNNSNTNSIISNNNSNTNNIINNNNSNTDKILDDSLPTDTDDKLEDLTKNDNLPSNVGIQDLITLPIRLYTSIVSSANTCEPVCFDLFDSNFCFPCFDIGSFFGTYWNVFDMLLCFVLLFKFATKLKEIFLNITQLDENKGDLIE